MFIFRLWQSEAHSEFDKPVHPAIMWPILHRPVTAHRGDHVTSSSQTSYCSDRWQCDQHFLMVETGYCTEPMLCRTEREKRTLQEQHAVNTYPEQLKNRDHTCTCNTETVPADSGKTWLSYILTTLVPSIFNEYQFSWVSLFGSSTKFSAHQSAIPKNT